MDEHGGFKGRRMENFGGRGFEQGMRGQERFWGNRFNNQSRQDFDRQGVQQGGWHPQQGDWNPHQQGN